MNGRPRPSVVATAAAALLLALLPVAAGAAETIRIVIDGVDRALADNIRSYLSLTRYAERTDLTDTQVRRLADRAVDEAADALRPFGYYDPQVRSRTVRDDATWIVRLRIKPGEPVLLRDVSIEVTGAGSDDGNLAQVIDASTVRSGERLDHPAWEKLKTDLLRTAIENGFLDARLVEHVLEVDPPRHVAEARLTLDTGGLYRFGKVQKASYFVPVDAIMSSPVPGIEERRPLTEAADLMDKHRTLHLGVTKGGALVGLVSVRDFLRPVSIDEF